MNIGAKYPLYKALNYHGTTVVSSSPGYKIIERLSSEDGTCVREYNTIRKLHTEMLQFMSNLFPLIVRLKLA